MDTSLVQGPGTMDAMQQIAMADNNKRPGLVQQALGQVYGHPLRNTMWEYALTPWNISNTARTGFAWKGIYGFRGFAKPQTGLSAIVAMPTTAIRRLVGGIGGNIFGNKATGNFFRTFGAEGFEGLSKYYASSSPGASRAFSLVGSALGGNNSINAGKLGYNWRGGFAKPIQDYVDKFGLTRLSSGKMVGVDLAETALTELSSKYGGFWGGFRPALMNEQNFVNKVAGELTGKLGITAEEAISVTTPWARGLKATKIMGGAATLSLWWDIAKFAATNTYKIARFGLEKANMALAGAAKQNWGGAAPQSFLMSGATTERQRALDEIGRSSMNARSLLGNEAGMAARTFSGSRAW